MYQEEDSYWFNHPHRKTPDINEIQKADFCYCPVCKDNLGFKTKKDIKDFHCNECKASFTFYPGIALPTAKLDSHKPKMCTCAQCKSKS